jgi:hypothetical protein
MPPNSASSVAGGSDPYGMAGHAQAISAMNAAEKKLQLTVQGQMDRAGYWNQLTPAK